MKPDGYSTPVLLPWSSAVAGRLPLSVYGSLHLLYCRVSDAPPLLLECCLYQSPRLSWSFLMFDDGGYPLRLPCRKFSSPARAENALLLALRSLYGLSAPAWLMPLLAAPRVGSFAHACGAVVFVPAPARELAAAGVM